jgi:hypothetical protein
MVECEQFADERGLACPGLGARAGDLERILVEGDAVAQQERALVRRELPISAGSGSTPAAETTAAMSPSALRTSRCARAGRVSS